MAIYKDYSEAFLREFKSSNKEGLDDLSLNEEERDNVEFSVSQSLKKIDLNVDYSSFSNHVFFGSALGAVNFSLARIFEYPIAGELKEKNEWKAQNSGFENYFFDNYPKQQGYANFVSGTANSWVELTDHEDKLRPGTGSFAFECIIKPWNRINSYEGRKAIFSYQDPDHSNGFSAYFSSSNKHLYFESNGSSNRTVSSCSYDAYVSSSHHLALIFDSTNLKHIFYVDGAQIYSASALSIGNLSVSSKKLYVGAMSSSLFGGFGSYFSGAVDDVRIWSGRKRSPELLARNYDRPINADISGGLKAYYKFNETSEVINKVIDYSGNDLHSTFTGSFVFGTNLISGTLGSWFKDPGEPIFSLANSRVDTFLTNWRTSGSSYDQSNRNIIFNLVPQFFIDDSEEHEDLQRFLLLLARHYDTLKLYIDNISNVFNTEQGEFGNTPDELLGVVAEHFGIDLGGVYEGASAVQYFFGDDVQSSGSSDTPVQVIRNQIRRNLVNSLIYIIKTKSTRESLQASLRSMGLPEDVVNINEYSILSGGIETTRTPRVVERKVASFPYSGAVNFTSSVYSGAAPVTYEFRTLFNTASTLLTSSLLDFSGAGSRLYLEIERQNLTSSNAIAKLYSISSSTTSVLSSSLLSMFDNNWINFAIVRNPPAQSLKLHVLKLDRDYLAYSSSFSSSGIAFASTPPTLLENRLGSRDGKFIGHMQEFRKWNLELSNSILQNHARDFDSLEVPDITRDMSALSIHLKLDDYSGSLGGVSNVHDYATGLSGAIYDESDGPFELVGKYIEKLEPSYSYDIGINNDKIRIRSGSALSDEELVRDIQYLSVDISPVVSLNREIMRWFGTLEKFNNIVGHPYLRYRQENDLLNQHSHIFFKNRLNDKLDFRAYFNLIKWFDSNFSFFLNQLIPLDIMSSLSNLVVEPHLMESNKVVYPFVRRSSENNVSLKSLIGIVEPKFIARGSAASDDNNSSTNTSLALNSMLLADPGRFGSPVSASANIPVNSIFGTGSNFSGTLGLNHQNLKFRELLTDMMQEDSGSNVPEGYGNAFYTIGITGSNYLKNVLNVNPSFNISGVHYNGDAIGANLYMTSSNRPINVHVTSSFNGTTDLRWQWSHGLNQGGTFDRTELINPGFEVGIGYGGAWGQLYSVCNKSLNAQEAINTLSGGVDADFNGAAAYGLGFNTKIFQPQMKYVSEKQESESSKTFTFWPSLNDIYPIIIESPASGDALEHLTGSIAKISPTDRVRKANSFGDIIDIEGYRHLNVNINGKRIIGSATHNIPIRFTIRFQFFDDTAPADNSFETVLSSAYDPGSTQDYESGSYTTISRPHEYSFFEQAVSLSSSHEFNIYFERPLPESKYMRMFTRIEFPTRQVDNTRELVYKIQCKATATTQDTENQDRIVFTGRN
jgi:hypothetical protein